MSAGGGPSALAGRQGALELCLAAGVFVLALLLCFPALHSLFQALRANPHYGHGYVLPVVAGYLVYRDRARIAAALRALRPARHGALVAFGAGALEVLLWMGDVGFGAGLGVPLVLGAAAFAVGGTPLLRPLMLPLAFIALMVPPPRFLVYELLFRLKLFVTDVSVALLQAGGAVVYADGNQILVPGHTLFVADACSGLTSIVSMFPLACVVACFFSRGFWRRAVVIVSVVPLALAANVLRVVVMVHLVSRLGEAVTQGALHEGFGMVTYAAGMLGVLLIARALG